MSDQRKPVLTGGCQCGAVRYALFAMPERAGICHCRMCQKAVGGPFSAWANVATQDFAWTRGAPGTFRSSSAAERDFCARCGTPLAFRYIQPPRRDERVDRQPGHARGGDAHGGGGYRKPLGQLRPGGMRRCPRTGPARPPPPEDLTRIAIYQHPDHDTPADWRPARPSPARSPASAAPPRAPPPAPGSARAGSGPVPPAPRSSRPPRSAA